MCLVPCVISLAFAIICSVIYVPSYNSADPSAARRSVANDPESAIDLRSRRRNATAERLWFGKSDHVFRNLIAHHAPTHLRYLTNHARRKLTYDFAAFGYRPSKSSTRSILHSSRQIRPRSGMCERSGGK